MEKEGYHVCSATDMQSAIRILNDDMPNIVITDLRVGEDSGVDLLKYIKSNSIAAECIIITAYGTIENAVESMRLGAFDYLTKPVNSSELKIRVKKALEKQEMESELTSLRKKLSNRNKVQGIVAASDEMKQIISLIEQIQDKHVPVLITGETGTGKEVIAQLIHETSSRSEHNFVAINCGALPEDLLDSELFGHIKGAFTGAVHDSKGLLAEADQGTIFLDEIGDISSRLQLRLLRFLQEGEVRPVGVTQARKVDVRIVAATNKDLKSLIAQDKFREDLYFRLSVLPIHIPPLRDRPQDIPVLTQYFIEKLSLKYKINNLQIRQSALEKLLFYDWPGNVRQLENTLARAIVLATDGVIHDDCIVHDEINDNRTPVKGVETPLISLDEHVKRYVERTIEFCSGNQTAAARILGISRSRLRRKLQLD